MRGHIRKRGTSYSIIVDIGRDPKTGKRQQKWFSGYKTKKEAEKALSGIIHELEQNTFVVPSETTVPEYLLYWLEQRRSNLSPTTISGYKTIIDKHLTSAFNSIKLKDLKPLTIHHYYNTKLESLSARTVLHHHRMLRKAMEDAKNWQLINNNPVDNVEAPKAKKFKSQVLNPQEIQLLFKALEGHRLEVPVSLMLFLGLRRGELLGLNWEDINYADGTITVQRNLVRGGDYGTELILKDPKTQESSRTIPLSSNIIAMLRRHELSQKETKLRLGPLYTATDFVFTKEDGLPWNPATFSRAFKDFLVANNLKQVRVHDLRHTNATLMLMSNIPAKVASERLGHSNISITLDLYSHVLKDMQQETTDKIDSILFDAK